MQLGPIPPAYPQEDTPSKENGLGNSVMRLLPYSQPHNTYTFIFTHYHLCMYVMYVFMYVWRYKIIGIYRCMHVCMNMYAIGRTYFSVCMYVCKYVRMYVYMYVCM